MKPSLLSALAIAVCVGCCSSAPRPSAHDSQTSGTLHKDSVAAMAGGEKADRDGSDRLVAAAQKDYNAGRVESAEKLLQAAVETDPRNNKAWYYLHLVRQRSGETPHRPELWYPTLPPRLAQPLGDRE